MTKKTYFISDAHFGSGFGNESSRADLFVEFADTLIGTDSELYIMGDFFDFWIEYGDVVRTDYIKPVAALYNLTRSGISVTIVRGNHDFMDHRYFSEEIGVTILNGHNSIKIGNHQFHLCHGDDLRGDWKYRALHRFLNNPIAQRGYRTLHPFIGVGAAKSLSQLSRKKSSRTGRYLSDDRQMWYHQKVNQILGETNEDIFVMGHTHRADISPLENGIYGNCGTWLSSPTVLIYDGETLALTEFTPRTSEKFTASTTCAIQTV